MKENSLILLYIDYKYKGKKKKIYIYDQNSKMELYL